MRIEWRARLALPSIYSTYISIHNGFQNADAQWIYNARSLANSALAVDHRTLVLLPSRPSRSQLQLQLIHNLWHWSSLTTGQRGPLLSTVVVMMNSWISASRRLILKDYVWNKKLNHDITECCTDHAMGIVTETWRRPGGRLHT